MAEEFGGLKRAQNFSRFYPVPNMGHCSGGAATDKFDLLTPLANWVENGTPPGPVNGSLWQACLLARSLLVWSIVTCRLSEGNGFDDGLDSRDFRP